MLLPKFGGKECDGNISFCVECSKCSGTDNTSHSAIVVKVPSLLLYVQGVVLIFSSVIRP